MLDYGFILSSIFVNICVLDIMIFFFFHNSFVFYVTYKHNLEKSPNSKKSPKVKIHKNQQKSEIFLVIYKNLQKSRKIYKIHKSLRNAKICKNLQKSSKILNQYPLLDFSNYMKLPKYPLYSILFILFLCLLPPVLILLRKYLYYLFFYMLQKKYALINFVPDIPSGINFITYFITYSLTT